MIGREYHRMAGSHRSLGCRRSCLAASWWTCCCKPLRSRSPTGSTTCRPPDRSLVRWTSRRWTPAVNPAVPGDLPRKPGIVRASKATAPAPRTTPCRRDIAAHPPSQMHRRYVVCRSSWCPWAVPRGFSRAAAARSIASFGSAGFLQDAGQRDVAVEGHRWSPFTVAIERTLCVTLKRSDLRRYSKFAALSHGFRFAGKNDTRRFFWKKGLSESDSHKLLTLSKGRVKKVVKNNRTQQKSWVL